MVEGWITQKMRDDLATVARAKAKCERGAAIPYAHGEQAAAWPDPTPEMIATPEFAAVWQCIKDWDIGVPRVYGGYCGATGNHVRAILDALAWWRGFPDSAPAAPYDTLEERDQARGSTLAERLDDGEVWP